MAVFLPNVESERAELGKRNSLPLGLLGEEYLTPSRWSRGHNSQRPIFMLGSPSWQVFQLKKPLNLDVNSCLLKETIDRIRKSFVLGLEDLRRNRESSSHWEVARAKIRKSVSDSEELRKSDVIRPGKPFPARPFTTRYEVKFAALTANIVSRGRVRVSVSACWRVFSFVSSIVCMQPDGLWRSLLACWRLPRCDELLLVSQPLERGWTKRHQLAWRLKRITGSAFQAGNVAIWSIHLDLYSN